MSEEPSDAEQWRRMLESVLGPEGAEEALRALESSGFDLSQLSQMPGVPADPALFSSAMAQMRHVLSTDDEGNSEWKIAQDVARQVAHTGGDPAVSAAQAERARAALRVADLWLDVATDLPPSAGTAVAASRAEWVERTLPVWRQVADPVAVSVAQALATTMGAEGAGLPEGLGEAAQGLLGGVDMGAMVRKLGRLSFAMQIGQGTGTLAREVFGATDTGLPLLTEPGVLLVPANIDAFTEGLDVPADEVWHFLAVREAAHARLFTHVPWLRSQLLGAVEEYARGIEIDLGHLEDAVRDIDPTDMEQLRSALAGGIFAPQHSESQQRALARLETILALIEGWVEEVTAAAVAPHLPHAIPLREMLRRRRAAGGPAEDTFAALVGLELRPRRARDAATLWATVDRERGTTERDKLWSHPDVFPTSADLDEPSTFLARREAAQAEEADVDEALAQMLSGELGYTQGSQEHQESADLREEESAADDETTDPGRAPDPKDTPGQKDTSGREDDGPEADGDTSGDHPA